MNVGDSFFIYLQILFKSMDQMRLCEGKQSEEKGFQGRGLGILVFRSWIWEEEEIGNEIKKGQLVKKQKNQKDFRGQVKEVGQIEGRVDFVIRF